MPNPPRHHPARRRLVPCLVFGAAMLAQGAAMAQASPPSQSNTIDKTAQTAPESEVTSGQKVTGHTRTHKDVASRTSPEQPAAATREKVKPSDRLRNWRNLSKDQVAPPADAPVKPGTNVAPGQDIPKPRAN